MNRDGLIERVGIMDDMNIGDSYPLIEKTLPFRMDCNNNGVFRFWGWGIKFKVGSVTSSTTISIVRFKEGE